jgi:hypothetical protein
MTGSEGLGKSEQAALKSYEHDLRLAISCIADVMLLSMFWYVNDRVRCPEIMADFWVAACVKESI